MPPKTKAPAGTKAKAKAADKEVTKKAKAVKTATKGKFTSFIMHQNSARFVSVIECLMCGRLTVGPHLTNYFQTLTSTHTYLASSSVYQLHFPALSAFYSLPTHDI